MSDENNGKSKPQAYAESVLDQLAGIRRALVNLSDILDQNVGLLQLPLTYSGNGESMISAGAEHGRNQNAAELLIQAGHRVAEARTHIARCVAVLKTDAGADMSALLDAVAAKAGLKGKPDE